MKTLEEIVKEEIEYIILCELEGYEDELGIDLNDCEFELTRALTPKIIELIYKFGKECPSY